MVGNQPPGSASFAERYGPWALITGGSEGVGGSWASAIAARGVNVVLVARRANVLEAKAKELRAEHGVEVRTLSVDITAPDLLERLDAVTHDLDVGMLVHNVGSTERRSRMVPRRLARRDGEDDRGQLHRERPSSRTRTRGECETVAGAGSSSWAR